MGFIQKKVIISGVGHILKGEDKKAKKMSTYSGVLWIAAMFGIVLMMGVFKGKLELILNFFLRGIVGMLLIYLANYFLADGMPDCLVGYNLISFFVCGFLGVPGVLLLYGIVFFKVLI